jgi:hypothetical protein
MRMVVACGFKDAVSTMYWELFLMKVKVIGTGV